MNELFFIFYQIIISIRIFIEMEDLTLSVFIHQLFWFNSVLMFFFICFRYLLKIEKNRLFILSAGSVLTFIPLAYTKLSGTAWALNYIQPGSLKQVAFDLATLLFFHEYNWPMFPELIALLFGSILLGTCLSKNLKLSIITSVTAVYGSFILLGFSWIAVNPEHPTLFLLRSGLKDSQFYAFQLITIFSILTIIGLFREVSDIFRNFGRPLVVTSLFFSVTLILQLIYLKLFIGSTYLTDLFVTLLPFASISLSAIVLFLSIFKIRSFRLVFLPLWIALFSIVNIL